MRCSGATIVKFKQVYAGWVVVGVYLPAIRAKINNRNYYDNWC